MKIMMLDTLTVVDVDEIEAVRLIDARMAVEGTLGIESAVIAPPRNAMKPRPEPKSAPTREKRGRRRRR